MIWITDEDRPIPTEPPVLCYWIFMRALQNPEAADAFGEVYRRFVQQFEYSLLLVRKTAIAKRRPPTIRELDHIDSVMVAGIFQPWCHQWAGWSDTMVGIAVAEALLRFFGWERRGGSLEDQRAVLGVAGVERDAGWEALLNPERPRNERRLRAEAEARAREGGAFRTAQVSALARWADYWWRCRIGGETLAAVAATIEFTPRQESGKRHSRGMDRKNLAMGFVPWDAAAGWVRKPGRKPKKVNQVREVESEVNAK